MNLNNNGGRQVLETACKCASFPFDKSRANKERDTVCTKRECLTKATQTEPTNDPMGNSIRRDRSDNPVTHLRDEEMLGTREETKDKIDRNRDEIRIPVCTELSG